MKWQGRERSDQVEDRRGQEDLGSSGGGFSFPSGGRGFGRGGMRVGGGFGLLILIIFMLLRGGCGLFDAPSDGRSDAPPKSDSGVVLPTLSHDATVTPSVGADVGTDQDLNIRDDDMVVQFLSVVLADTEKAWGEMFQAMGRHYQKPKLVIYDGSTMSACGQGNRETGPFYCPGDDKVYIDVSFFRDMASRYRASGDFAVAYVLAHEVGHHVQNLLGVSRQVDAYRGRVSKTEMNRLSVRLELQADYLAGVWAHYAFKHNLLSDGDIDEALNATAAIGDDRLQRQARGYVVPDSFTHGTSAQRSRWFKKGFQSGTLDGWDTFSIPYESLVWPSVAASNV